MQRRSKHILSTDHTRRIFSEHLQGCSLDYLQKLINIHKTTRTLQYREKLLLYLPRVYTGTSQERQTSLLQLSYGTVFRVTFVTTNSPVFKTIKNILICLVNYYWLLLMIYCVHPIYFQKHAFCFFAKKTTNFKVIHIMCDAKCIFLLIVKL